MSAALRPEFPGLRIFYNCGHIHKQGPKRFAPYSHLELESLPTGGWGMIISPRAPAMQRRWGWISLGRPASSIPRGVSLVVFKHPDALEYEVAQMVALGSKCLVGDQLHPNGAINPDTYASIAPAYARIEKLEPYLEGASQVSEVAILSAEYFHSAGDRNNHADDGAAQMLLELKRPFDVIDPSTDFANYRVIILPDEVPVEGEVAQRLNAFLGQGGKLLLSGRSGLGADGNFAVPAGIVSKGEVSFTPSYLRAGKALDGSMTTSPFVVYGTAQAIEAQGAEVLAEVVRPYFNRGYQHFSSHAHTPDDPMRRHWALV